MDKNGGGGVKVTYIETQFVTSDAASFKELVQRLTGRSAGAAPAPAAPPRPRACRAAGANGGGPSAAGGPRGCYYASAAAAAPAIAVRGPPCLEELHEMGDFSKLFYAGASEQSHGRYGGYSDFPY